MIDKEMHVGSFEVRCDRLSEKEFKAWVDMKFCDKKLLKHKSFEGEFTYELKSLCKELY